MPVARKFFRECLALADDDRDIDLYHWSSTRFSAVWRDTLSVLVARGRAQVSVAAAVADWPKRIRDMRYVDHEDYDGTDKVSPSYMYSQVECIGHAWWRSWCAYLYIVLF